MASYARGVIIPFLSHQHPSGAHTNISINKMLSLILSDVAIYVPMVCHLMITNPHAEIRACTSPHTDWSSMFFNNLAPKVPLQYGRRDDAAAMCQNDFGSSIKELRTEYK